MIKTNACSILFKHTLCHLLSLGSQYFFSGFNIMTSVLQKRLSKIAEVAFGTWVVIDKFLKGSQPTNTEQ